MSDVRVTIDKVLCDTEADTCVVILKSDAADQILPIFIGQAEAFSIAMAQEEIELPRPITHDLIESILENVGVTLDWIRIESIAEGTYFATMHIHGPNGEKDVDCRPSDGIAVAIRVGAPIFVAEEVMNSATDPLSDLSDRLEGVSEELLANLPDAVFGKYKM